MNILLLGASGFVGTNVGNVLASHNIAYHTASRATGTDGRSLPAMLTMLEEAKPDIIINCAAHVGSLNYVTEQAATVVTDNALLILNLYQAVAATNKHCIIINPIANCTYPAVDEKFVETELWNGPVHPSVYAYGGAKRFLLTVAKSFAMQYDIKSIQLLVPNMYGPHDSTDPNKAHALNALISRFVKAERMGNPNITLWGTGIAVREWLYAEDFGKIIYQIIKDAAMQGLEEPINIAQNTGLTVKELTVIIQQHFTTPSNISWDANMPNGAPKKVMDDALFKKVFPHFSFANFNEGIASTIAYYHTKFPY